MEQISLQEWGILFGASFIGIVVSYISFQAFTLISPTFISSLKTIELVIAVTFHKIISTSFPRVEESLAAILIILGITCLLLENLIRDTIKICFSYRYTKSS